MSTVAANVSSGFLPLRTRGARLLRLPSVRDDRGCLVWGEAGSQLPFAPTRFWSVVDVPAGETRGNHAHRRLHEVLVCLRGSCSVSLDDGVQCDEVALDDAETGLYVPPLVTRGNHAHRRLHEVLVCLRGSCSVSLDDGVQCDEVALDDAETGLYVPPLVWNRQHRFSADAVLLVLANERYRPEDYIRDRAEFAVIAARGG